MAPKKTAQSSTISFSISLLLKNWSCGILMEMGCIYSTNRKEHSSGPLSGYFSKFQCFWTIKEKEEKRRNGRGRAQEGGTCDHNVSKGSFYPCLRPQRTKFLEAGPVPTCSLLCPSCSSAWHVVCYHKYWLIKAYG